MAIGADLSLPKSQPSALRMPAPMRPQSQPTVSRPPMIADSAIQSAVNNQLEAGAGAREVARQTLDRTAGLSRGKGIEYAADIAQSDADAKARAGAAATEMGAASSNAASQFAYDKAMGDERLMNAGLLEGLRHSSSMESLNSRGLQQQLMEAMRRGQFGLDQMQLDYSPFMASLLR